MSFFHREPGEAWHDYLVERFRRLLPFFWSNWISAVGSIVVITVSCLLVLLLLLFIYNAVLDRPMNPYVGLVGYLVLPIMWVGGAVLVGIGQLVRRRRRLRHPERRSRLEDGRPVLPRRLATIAVVTLVCLAGFGVFSYEAYHYTDSNDFCVNVCHTVMQPEGTAYEGSPHARVPCVECHIGSGANWYVRSKLSGIRQVWAVLTDSYDTPIPTPVENLRPARQTCEQCHWPARFHGSKLAVTHDYQPDSTNTQTVTALVLKVGGPVEETGRARGIHWHVDPGNEIWYRHLDRQRQDIVEVRQQTPRGEVLYLAPGATADSDSGSWRLMDCVDCHNRPTHRFEMPGRAVDLALTEGGLDRDLPWLRQEAVAVLKEIEPGPDTAARIATELEDRYRSDHPQDLEALRRELPRAAAVLARILERNVFPAMDVTWGTYWSNIGHFKPDGDMGGGCFRCHDGEHEAEGGQTIQQDCDTCHALLAWDETKWSGLPGVDTSFWQGR